MIIFLQSLMSLIVELFLEHAWNTLIQMQKIDSFIGNQTQQLAQQLMITHMIKTHFSQQTAEADPSNSASGSAGPTEIIPNTE